MTVIHLQMVNTRHGHAIYPLYTAMAQNTCEIFQKLNCNRHSPANGQYTALTCHISAVHCNGTTHLRNISKIELKPSFTRKWSIQPWTCQKLNYDRHSPANGQYTPWTCHISAVHCNGTKHL